MRDRIVLHRGDKYNPETRCGQPRKLPTGRIFHTWYTTELFLSYATDEIMERLVADKVVTRRRSNRTVLYERPRSVYYGDGLFWVPSSRKNAAKVGAAFDYEPVTGTIRTEGFKQYQKRYGLPDALIYVENGFPTDVVIGEDSFHVTPESWPTMESFLGLDESYKPERYRPRRSA